MKIALVLFLFLGPSHALFGISFEPSRWFNWFQSAYEKYDQYKLEALRQWNSGSFAAVFGREILQKAKEYNPSLRISERDIQFYLYTKSNPSNPVEIWTDPQVLARTAFDTRAPVKIICHGFLSNYRKGPGKSIAPMYLQHIYNVNVIVIDWSSLSGIFLKSISRNNLKENIYFPPARYTETVGRATAAMVDFLVGRGVSMRNIHLIGHSLGAHAMGWAGRSVKSGRVPRITALDAASPCFETKLTSSCFDGNYVSVSKDDADFVDAIHTHARFYGYTRPIGHVDFYPNGGFAQPGCTLLQFGTCSHSRSIDLFAESINPSSRLVGQKCSDWETFAKKKCSSNEIVRMGEFCPWTARGTFYLATRDASPYSIRGN